MLAQSYRDAGQLPASDVWDDGVTYRFAVENGILTVRPCIASAFISSEPQPEATVDAAVRPGPAQPTHMLPKRENGWPGGNPSQYFPQPPTPNLVGLAQNAVSALIADAPPSPAGPPKYCVDVGHPGTAVNTAVHLFKTAYDLATSGVDGNPLPHNGLYDTATQGALNAVLSAAGLAANAPAHC
jgi:hypothetical protein